MPPNDISAVGNPNGGYYQNTNQQPPQSNWSPGSSGNMDALLSQVLAAGEYAVNNPSTEASQRAGKLQLRYYAGLKNLEDNFELESRITVLSHTLKKMAADTFR